MTDDDLTGLMHKAARAEVLRLFLDYDGTLAEFASTPDIVMREREILSVLERLVSAKGILPAIISGRRLAHIQKLMPVDGLLLGGTYGIEMQLPDGNFRSVIPFEMVRPTIETLLPHWREIIGEREGFYLEDKGWALAIHGRFAQKEDVEFVMTAAQEEARNLQPDLCFRIMGGDRFLEYAPCEADKSKAVQWVLQELTPQGAMVIYFGDDDKDEAAFEVVAESGGFAVRVADSPVVTGAQFRVKDPSQVRAWLHEFLVIRNT
ncbi:MAG: trehalose-phosphatase [Anaerolineales bacterium]|nr:trehalose-phosphatase [Anaerolineales bacterium]